MHEEGVDGCASYLEDIIAVDDTGLDVQFLEETHFAWYVKGL